MTMAVLGAQQVQYGLSLTAAGVGVLHQQRQQCCCYSGFLLYHCCQPCLAAMLVLTSIKPSNVEPKTPTLSPH